MATWTPAAWATVRQASMAAGVEPQSSCSLNPDAPARSCSHRPSALTVLPLPSSTMLTGHSVVAFSIISSQNAPGEAVVALVPSAGPVPPPISVVIPAASATGICCGAIRCTWVSMPPAVRIMPLPERISVDGPMTSSGVTPSMVSGLPALPRATIRPSRMPMSALITPQWSSTTAPVMTRSGVPSARVTTDWPIDSRMTLPPPKIASSPASGPGPPQRSSVTSISRSVSASRTRSPVVGPYRAAYLARDTSVIERTGVLGPQAGHHPRPGQRDQGDRPGHARLEPHRSPGRDVQPVAAGRGAVEGQRRVGRGEVVVRADLDGPVPGVLGGQLDPGPPGSELDRAVRGEDLAWDHAAAPFSGSDCAG